MDENQLKIAAFAKMVNGEPLTIADAQRVWDIVLNTGMNIDSSNQQGVAQFVSQLKGMLQQKFFSNGQ